MKRKRFSFLFSAWDALEPRVVLSHASPGLAPPALVHPQSAGRALTVGALGDSYTDEYRFYPPDLTHARNWVEILAATRGVDFGKFTTKSRGEPRNQGFAFNWARFDATSSNMIQNQLPGLSAQVAAGQVKYAWIFIGGNDFLDFLREVQAGSITLAQAPAALGQVETQAAANFTTAVDTLLAASPNVRLVVSTVPDVSALPIVQQELATLPQAKPVAADTSQAIGRYNASIEALAASDPRIALVDLAGQSAELTQLSGSSVPFGGTSISLATPGDDYHDFFLADGLHIGTVGQSFIANDFLTAIDSHFGARVTTLSSPQIVKFAKRVSTKEGSRVP
jgi:phospholipase/lecithinase/hemolysin